MVQFDLKKSSIYQAIRWKEVFKIIGFLNKLFFWGFLISIPSFWLYQPANMGNPWLFFLTLFGASKVLEFFFETKLKKPSVEYEVKEILSRPEEFNSAEALSFQTTDCFNKAMIFSKRRGQTLTNSSVLLFFLLRDNPELKFIFSKLLLNIKELQETLEQTLETTSERDFEEIMLSCLKTAEERGHQVVQIGDLLIALAKNNNFFKDILVKYELYPQDVENLVWWLENLKERREEEKRFWEYRNLLKKGSIGRRFAVGYTSTLDQFSTDWTAAVRGGGYGEIIGHKKEIKQMERILAGNISNNLFLIGEPGSGRKIIIQFLARKISFGQSLPSLNYKRLVELDVLSLAAQAETQEKANTLLETIFQEALAVKNIILVIDELPNFVGDRPESGLPDISGMLLKYLRFPQLRMIGICDFMGFHNYVEKNLSLSSVFGRVKIKEVSEKETILILENLVPSYEKKYKRFISYPAIRDIVRYCQKYLPESPFPEKAIDLLDEVMPYVVRDTKSKLVLPEHIATVVGEKTEIPVGKLEVKEKEVLLNLEKLIHQRIVNQTEAVREISTAMRRARAGITIRKGPIGAFLFLGPTGVGKTETSKALTVIYFGDEKRMIRLDMSEFQSKTDVARLIGGREYEGILVNKIKEIPFSLLLLDEIEKAHPDILNLFLQVIDEGHLTDGLGRKVSFKNSIIIATSNAGYKIILQALEDGSDWSQVKKKLLDELFEKGIFRPEFINRFDAVVVFSSLTKDNLLDIAQLMLNKLKKNLAEKYIEIEFTQELKEKVAELSYNPIFGAREMRRVIQDKIENVIARDLLNNKIKRGDKIIMDVNFNIIKQRN